MKNKFLAAIIAGVMLASCSEQKSNDKHTAAMPEVKMDTPKQEKKFAGLAFANTKDYICGMPVTAGIEDTVTYKGKLYGFCSKECKDEFIKSPGQYLSSSK